MENVSYAPGPGAYNPSPLKIEKNYSIPKSQSTSKLNSKESPGPGSYEPKVSYNSQYESIGINKDKRRAFYDEKSGIPGPGQYSFNDSTIPKNGFSIGHEKRGGNKSSENPGPGNYNLPSTVSNLPTYVGIKHK
jgi:hypothetical protein